MPDFSDGRDGGLSITFCTMGGETGTLKLDLVGQPDRPSTDDHLNHDDCPFGIVVSQAVMPSQEAPALVGALSHRPVGLPHRNQARPPLPALGPPLGSRAPPSNLG